MTEREKARHRATSPATTPLSILGTGINQVVGDRFDALGRGGAVLVVTSGLVASVGLPALAAPETGGLLSGDTKTLQLGLGTLANSLADAPKTVGSVGSTVPLTAIDSAAVSGSEKAAAQAANLANPVAAQRAAQAASVLDAVAGTSTKASIAQAAKTVTVKSAAVKTAAVKTAAVKSAAVKSTAVKTGVTARGSAAIAVAARYVGIYYRYGGTTPAGFDCSGYTKHVYKQLGVNLPRTAQQQLRAVTRISRSEAKVGDLVFMVGSSGTAYHVGIYAGNNMMYDSPRSGKKISKRKIWTSRVVFGRA